MQAGCFEVTQSSLAASISHASLYPSPSKGFFRMFDVFSQNIEDRIVFFMSSFQSKHPLLF
jgi:hypothetical protein